MEASLNRETILRILRNELPYLSRRFGVATLALYGSYASDTATATSDVDLLVELGRPLGLEFVALAEYLESVLGRTVDLSTFETLERSLQMSRYRHIALNIQETKTDVRLETR